MNKLLTILCFLGNMLFSQQIIELCDDKVIKSYTASTTAQNIDFNVIPFTAYQVDNLTVYITYANIGTYVLTAKFSNNLCYQEDKLIINVIECKETTFYIPNAFTPDGDKLNDEFGAYGVNIRDFSMEIYNKWGELLFTSNELNNRWNGKYKDSICQIDVYSYKIIYKDIKNKLHIKYGTLTLTI
jgi:gliding motility-associated-like protein